MRTIVFDGITYREVDDPAVCWGHCDGDMLQSEDGRFWCCPKTTSKRGLTVRDSQFTKRRSQLNKKR